MYADAAKYSSAGSRRNTMKHAKRIISVVLVAVFLVCLMPAVMADSSYKDVPKGAWYEDAVTYCTENGLMRGVNKDTFSPDTPIDRAMFVTVLYRLAGEPATDAKSPFKDVADDSYCCAAVAWAAKLGVVFGYEDGSFRPHKSINREQMACMLARYMLLIDAPFIYGPEAELYYSDSKLISDYAKESVNLIRKTGLMRGFSDGEFRPQATASRAEAATLFSRFLIALERELPATLIEFRGDMGHVWHRYILTKADADKLAEYLGAMKKEEGLHAEFVPTHMLRINGVDYDFEITDAGQVPVGCNYSLGDDLEFGFLSGETMPNVIEIMNSYI